MALVCCQGRPLAELHAFDIAVVDPTTASTPQLPRPRQPQRRPRQRALRLRQHRRDPRLPQLGRPGACQLAHRHQRSLGLGGHRPGRPGWTEFVADTIVAPLWEKGYRGLFLDTLDSYRLASGADMAAQQAGISAHPAPPAGLLSGHPPDPQPRLRVPAPAAGRGVRRGGRVPLPGWNAAPGATRKSPKPTAPGCATSSNRARDEFGLPAIAIDYVPPQPRQLARGDRPPHQGRRLIPWVADGALATPSASASVEVIPRRVMVLHDGREVPQLNFTNAHRFLEMPLNHLGYMVDYIDVNGHSRHR